MSSSFGAESALLIHMATRAKPDIKVIVVDTGYLFPETHAFLETLRHRFDLNIWTYRTRQDPIRYLLDANETDPTFRNNVEALLRRQQERAFRAGHARAETPRLAARHSPQPGGHARRTKAVEWSNRFSCYAVSPLLNWSRKEIHQYMKQHDLPYHPLFDQGYASIGCNPLSCTRPIQIGEDPRAGRWSGTGKLECGLHLESDGSGI